MHKLLDFIITYKFFITGIVGFFTIYMILAMYLESGLIYALADKSDGIDLKKDKPRFNELCGQVQVPAYITLLATIYSCIATALSIYSPGIAIFVSDANKIRSSKLLNILTIINLVTIIVFLLWRVISALVIKNKQKELKQIVQKGRLYWCDTISKNTYKFNFENYLDEPIKILDYGFEIKNYVHKKVSLKEQNDLFSFEAKHRDNYILHVNGIDDFNRIPVTFTQIVDDIVCECKGKKIVPMYFYIKTNYHDYCVKVAPERKE